MHQNPSDVIRLCQEISPAGGIGTALYLYRLYGTGQRLAIGRWAGDLRRL